MATPPYSILTTHPSEASSVSLLRRHVVLPLTLSSMDPSVEYLRDAVATGCWLDFAQLFTIP